MIRTLVIGAAAALLAASPALACADIASKTVKLSACIDDAQWLVQTPQGVQEYSYFSDDDKIAFSMIAEKETVAISAYRSAILANAASIAAGDTNAVKVTGERIETVGGKPWNVIEYSVTSPDGEYAFINFYYSQPGFGSTQLAFYSVPADVTEAAFRAGQLLATVQFVP